MFGGFNLGSGFQLPDLSDTLMKLHGTETQEGTAAQQQPMDGNRLTEGLKSLTDSLHRHPVLGKLSGSTAHSTGTTPTARSGTASRMHSPGASKLSSPPGGTVENGKDGWGFDEDAAGGGGSTEDGQTAVHVSSSFFPGAPLDDGSNAGHHVASTTFADNAHDTVPTGDSAVGTASAPTVGFAYSDAEPGAVATPTLPPAMSQSPAVSDAKQDNALAAAALEPDPHDSRGQSLQLHAADNGQDGNFVEAATRDEKQTAEALLGLGHDVHDANVGFERFQAVASDGAAEDPHNSSDVVSLDLEAQAALSTANKTATSTASDAQQHFDGALTYLSTVGHDATSEAASSAGAAKGVSDAAESATVAAADDAVCKALRANVAVVADATEAAEVLDYVQQLHAQGDERETVSGTMHQHATAQHEGATQHHPAGVAAGTNAAKLAGVDDVDQTSGAHQQGHVPQVSPHVSKLPPLQDVSHLDAPALRQLVEVLQEALNARQVALEERTEELSNQKMVVVKLTAKNAELAKRSAKLSEDDYEQLRAEFEERLAAADRKAYALAKERDALRRGNEKLNSVNELLKAKDDMIKELMDEGEKLAKKQLANDTAARKLWSQVEQLERERVRLSGVSAEQSSKLESLRGEKAMLENQIQTMMEHHKQLLDQERRHAAADLAAARRAQADAEAAAASAARDDSAQQLREAAAQVAVLEETVVELQGALEQNRTIANQREDALKREVASLEERCQEANMRHEELAAKLPETTGPLIRQIEALQAASAQQAATWQLTERTLVSRLNDAESRAAAAVQLERVMQERLASLQSASLAAEGALEAAQGELQELRGQLDGDSRRRKQAERQCETLESRLADLNSEMQTSLADKADVITMLEQQLDALQAQNVSLAKKVRELEDRFGGGPLRGGAAVSAGAPALAAPGYKWVLLKDTEAASLANGGNAQHGIANGTGPLPGASLGGPLGRSESHGSASDWGWRLDSGRSSSHVWGPPGPQATQGNGGVADGGGSPVASKWALQQQVASLEAARDGLSDEVLHLQRQLQGMAETQNEVVHLQRQMQELAQERAALVELLGERQERLEEALADVEDVKAMMKQQSLYIVEGLQKAGIQNASSIVGALRSGHSTS